MEPKPSTRMSVPEFYAGKNIFITGATGFIGKTLIEKLLRSCPRVGKIYMLIRTKHGRPAKDRLHKFLECPIFDNLRKNSPDSLKKLSVVTGDTTLEGLGISDDDKNEVQRQCNVVFHSAACVRFDLSLRLALDQNTRATQRVLALVEGMKNLEVFVHISTSYCQHENIVLEEKLYPTESPQRIMDLVDWMRDDMLADVQSKLIHPHGNTYGYTKALSETLVSQYSGKFPVAVARPSIVTASLTEPMPGWVDNLNGPTGVLIASGKGVLRSMIGDKEALANAVPLDLVVNSCVLLAYLTALDKPQDIRVCNITQSEGNARSWQYYITSGMKIINEYPFTQFLWVPGGTLKKSRLHHNIVSFFVHFLPAHFLDVLLYLLGKKPFMVKIYNRLNYAIDILDYYTMRNWKFSNDYFRSLKNAVSKEDDEQFYTGIELIDWESYITNYVLGAQKYILKEEPAQRPRAKRLYNVVWCVDKLLTAVFYGLLLYVAFTIINVLFF